MTAASFLAILVGTAYHTDDKTAALTSAANALNVTADTDNQVDAAIAKVAAKILLNQKIHESDDPAMYQFLTDMEELIQDESEKLKIKKDASTIYNILQYKQPSSNLHWSQG